MRLHEIMERAIDGTVPVVRGVEPERFGAPTPCAAWDVRALTNHLLLVATALRLTGERQPVPDELWTSDVLTEGWAGDFEREARAAAKAWAGPEAWEGTIPTGRWRSAGGIRLSHAEGLPCRYVVTPPPRTGKAFDMKIAVLGGTGLIGSHPYARIADVLQSTEPAVRQLVSRARKPPGAWCPCSCGRTRSTRST